MNRASSKAIQRIPVIVLSGFLGSGKTTLLNGLLHHVPDSALIINEFGQTPIDQQLIDERKIPMTTLAGGCLCCQVRGSLAPLLKNLRMAWDGKTEKPFKRIFIETSGVASPEPILDTLLNERWLAPRYDYRGMIATVSAASAENYLFKFPEAQAQIVWASKLVITQTDLVDGDRLSWLDGKLDELAPATPRVTVVRGDFDPEAMLRFDQGFRLIGRTLKADVPEHGFRSVSLHLDHPVAWRRLQTVLQNLLDDYRDRIVRIKGVVITQEHDNPQVVQGISGRLFAPVSLPPRDGDDGRSRLVFITAGEIGDLAESIIAQLRLYS